MTDKPDGSWFKHAIIGSVAGALCGAAVAMILGALGLSIPGGSGIVVGCFAGVGAAGGVNVGKARAQARNDKE